MFRKTLIALIASAAMTALPSLAQDSAPIEDEVITFGKRQTSGNKAMRAFDAGDFATAEVEFDKHYTSLRRTRRAVENSVRNAADGIDTADIRSGLAQVGGAGEGASSGGNAAPRVNATNFGSGSATLNPNLSSLVLDGDAKDTDFAFSKYMSGLSQIQLGKFAEAKRSFEVSLDFNRKNYDARMRLGLLELRDGNFDRARKHLIKLDTLRKDCVRRCTEKNEITAATRTLAEALSARS